MNAKEARALSAIPKVEEAWMDYALHEIRGRAVNKHTWAILEYKLPEYVHEELKALGYTVEVKLCEDNYRYTKVSW